MTLRNRPLGRSSHIIKEEKVGLKMHAKKKIDEVEELKEGVYSDEFQSVKILEDLNFLKHEEAAATAEIELQLIRSGISKELTNLFKNRSFEGNFCIFFQKNS